jgi:predicted naringenin-chalcone synthase
MSYITAVGAATPAHRHAQADIAAFMEQTMALNGNGAHRLRTLFRATGIAYRASVIPDYGGGDTRTFFPPSKNAEPFPTTSRRMQLFAEHAPALSAQAVREVWRQRPEVQPGQITHLVVASCTGLYAPGLDIDLVQALGLSPHVQRTCINFMGCYAAFNALKAAHSFCALDAGACVLVVCTELCSLHFQKEPTDDNLLANALFADGAAALLAEAQPRRGLNFRPVSFFCDLAPEGMNDMAWRVGNWGFEMRLSAYVPNVIRSGIQRLTQRLMAQTAHRQADYFAIHPGGKKILEAIGSALAITKAQNAAAYHVLREYGNMSSPTVLFVLKHLAAGLDAGQHGKTILSFAFGPGLTLESMLLQIVYSE